MRDLDDFDLRPGDEPSPDPRLRSREPAPSTGPSGWDDEPSSRKEPVREPTAAASRRRSRTASVAAGLILAGSLVVAFWMMSRRVEPPEPGTKAETEATAESTAPTGDEPPRSSELEAPLPPLDQSDALVRQLVGALSRQPALTAWLATGNLIRTFAAAVENASLGASPSPNLRFLQPRDPYRAIERSGPGGRELVPDPASYRRYDLVTAVFTSIDPQAAADVYRRLRGLVQEAFAELGYPDQSFDSALAAAFETVLATPIPDTAPVLERHVNSYRYADPDLEELAPVQKHLLRMGPDHARSVKAQIRALAAELELGVD
jgi:Protein of unknown function (DUF3014)